MSKEKPPKREFNPRSHGAVYLLAVVYLCYLIFQMVKRYLAGGPDAPSVSLLVGGIALLGGGCVILGILARKMFLMPVEEETEQESETDKGEEEEEAHIL